MGFDIENFGIGYAAGLASAYVIYRVIPIVQSVRQAVTQQASTAQSYATRSGLTRYTNDLIKASETKHLFGEFIELSKTVVEPRFIPAPELAAPPDDDVVHSVFHIVPQIPDFPYLQAPYNIETMSVEDLGKGDRAIALLGLPGSGRTTALYTIALWGLGRVNFAPPPDTVQEMLDKEEASLSDEDRATRIKERLFIQERAKERLAEEQGEEYSAEDESKLSTSLFRRLVPLYVHLANISLDVREYHKQIGPAEPLVRALQYQVKRVTAKTMPRNIYKTLVKGQALILLDGYDELPPEERRDKLAWLEAFLDQYGRNFVIVSGPVSGYGDLIRAGLTPTFLRPWSDQDTGKLADNFATSWGSISSKRRAQKPDDELIIQVKADTRALSAFDVSLKTWSTYTENTDADGLNGWLQAFIEHSLPDIDDILPQIAQAAALQLDETFITPDRLTALEMGDSAEVVTLLDSIVDEEPRADENTGDSGEDDVFDIYEIAQSDDDDEVDVLLSETEEQTTSIETESEGKVAVTDKDVEKEVRRIRKEKVQLLNRLQNSKLVVQYKGNRYQFSHQLIAAYLAGQTLVDAEESLLEEKALDPAWSQAIAYASSHISIEAAVNARLQAPADMLQNNVLEVSRWLSYAGTEVPWRKDILRKLGNMLIASHQYPLLRERAAAALVGTRDKSSLVVFRRAARNANVDVRRLSCLSIGALQDPETIGDLEALLLQDQSGDVQLAAGLGLGAIGNEEALEIMADALITGTEQIRQAVAETFAAIPEEGYPVLYDAVRHEEMMLRRAAVSGLRRVKTAWALIAVYRAFLEDEQWYVRSAAQQAFQDMQSGENQGAKGYPPVEAIVWLRSWASELGDELPENVTGNQLLLMALQDNEPLTRHLSATTIGQLGLAGNIEELYGALLDQEEAIRDAAHRALGELQLQIGQSLPAPI